MLLKVIQRVYEKNPGTRRWRRRISWTGISYFAVVFIITATQEKNLSKNVEKIKNSLLKRLGLHKKEKNFSGDHAGV